MDKLERLTLTPCMRPAVDRLLRTSSGWPLGSRTVMCRGLRRPSERISGTVELDPEFVTGRPR